MSKGQMFGVALLIAIAMMALGGQEERAQKAASTPAPTFYKPDFPKAPPAPPPPPHHKVLIEKQSWEKGGFGSVAIASLSLKNLNDYPVKDISLRCEYSGESGTVLNTHLETVFRVIPPKKTIRVRDMNIGFINSQAARGGCSVIAAIQAGPAVVAKEEKSATPTPAPKPASLKGVY